MSLAPIRQPKRVPPAAHAWIIDPDQVRADRRDQVPRYGDDRWSLLALTNNPSADASIISWDWFPDAYRETFRHATWALIAFPLPSTATATHVGAPLRDRLSTGRIFKTVKQWAVFARWLLEHGITTLTAVTVDDLTAFAAHLAGPAGMSRNTACSHLITLTRLHHYSGAYLPAEQHLTEPPWIRQGHDDYLPAASSGGENRTEPITAATMGPLLVWSLRFVEEFADDILNAHEERQRLTAAAEAAEAAVPAPGRDGALRYLTAIRDADGPIPAVLFPDQPARAAITYLAAKTGTPPRTLAVIFQQPAWREYLRAHHTTVVLDTPVTGTFHGQPWHEPFPFQGPSLVRHLVTACYIVIAYLTGMRLGEVLALEAGCCPSPAPGGTARQLIYTADREDRAAGEADDRATLRGRQFKNAVDDDGNHDSAGVDRVPWIAVAPVVSAVRVLERLGRGERLLFEATVHDRRTPETRGGRSLSPVAITNRIKAFIAWVNDYAQARGRDVEAIPPDVHGSIGPARFRRTLAWHIARRPGGLVALAVQYGHLRTVVSEGYAARSRNGIHELLDFETARAVAADLTDLHEALQDGTGVSGPAARRLIHAAGAEHRRFGGMITTTRQARSLLADPALNVFHNSEAFLFCNYDKAKALCHTGRSSGTAPSLDRCRTNCANIARTDEHAQQLDQAAADLRVQAESPLLPGPLADRLALKADHLTKLAADHRAGRITPTEDNDE